MEGRRINILRSMPSRLNSSSRLYRGGHTIAIDTKHCPVIDTGEQLLLWRTENHLMICYHKQFHLQGFGNGLLLQSNTATYGVFLWVQASWRSAIKPNFPVTRRQFNHDNKKSTPFPARFVPLASAKYVFFQVKVSLSVTLILHITALLCKCERIIIYREFSGQNRSKYFFLILEQSSAISQLFRRGSERNSQRENTWRSKC